MDRWKATALVLAGILVGVVFAGPGATGAEGHQMKQFKECAALRLDFPPRKGLGGSATVPTGWTPVGGGGSTAMGVVVCR